MDESCFAYGWAYDPDRGTNDDGANDYDDDGDGMRSNALGNGSNVKVYADGMYKGIFNAELSRCDVKNAGAAPDCYHGFKINLNSFLNPGIHTIEIKGVEYPELSLETKLHGTIDVNIGDCTLHEVSSPGSLNPLIINKNSSSPTGYYLYFNETINARGYNLYEGNIGNYYSHGVTPNFCNISFQSTLIPGRLRHELNPSSGNHYYLITAYSYLQESTSGSSSTSPRPQEQNVCPPN